MAAESERAPTTTAAAVPHHARQLPPAPRYHQAVSPHPCSNTGACHLGSTHPPHLWCLRYGTYVVLLLSASPLLRLCSLSAPLFPELRELRGIFRRSNKEKSVRAGGADAASGTVLGLARCLPHAPPVLACGMPWCWACAGLVLVVLVVPAHIAPLSGLQIEPTYQTPELKLFGAQLNQYNDATRFPTMKSSPIACPGYKADSGCCHGRHR